MSKPAANLFIHILLIAITAGVFWKSLNNEFIYYDDPQYVTENNHIQNLPLTETIRWAFTSTYAANWHPLTWLSHTLDYKLFGLKTAGHHLTNLLFHIANVLLLFALLKNLTGAIWRSAFVAALFAIHPLHVESVAWISERKDVLSTFFMFLTIAAYLRYVKNQKIGIYLLTLLLFALGLMAKPMLVTLPFVFLLLDYWPLERLKNISQLFSLIREKIPFFVLSAASCIVTCIAQRKAMTDIEVFPFGWRAANSIVSYLTYIEKMFMPVKLAILYPLAGNLPSEGIVVLAILILLTITILVIRYSTKRKYLLFGWFFFLGTLVPVIGLVQVGMQQIADRYTYVPLIGLFIMIGWGITDLLQNRKIILTAGAVLIISALSVCTINQLNYWHDSMSLFNRAIAVTKNNYIAYNNLGFVFVEQKNFDKAIEHYKKAIEINPSYAEALSNLGAAYGEIGKYDEGLRVLKRSLEIRPDSLKAYSNLGTIYTSMGNWRQAAEVFEKCLRIDSEKAEIYEKLGLAYSNLQQPVKAIENYKKAYKLKPHTKLANNLAVLLIDQDQTAEAMNYLTEAIKNEPNYADAYNNLGLAYGKMNRPLDEIDAYKKAIGCKSDYAEAYYNLGASYSNMGKYAEAIDAFKNAVKFKPEDSWAHYGLGTAYLKVNDRISANSEYEFLKKIDSQKAQMLHQLLNK